MKNVAVILAYRIYFGLKIIDDLNTELVENLPCFIGTGKFVRLKSGRDNFRRTGAVTKFGLIPFRQEENGSTKVRSRRVSEVLVENPKLGRSRTVAETFRGEIKLRFRFHITMAHPLRPLDDEIKQSRTRGKTRSTIAICETIFDCIAERIFSLVSVGIVDDTRAVAKVFNAL